MIVMKFGGTSVQDAAAMGRLAAIVADRRAERPVVVVSALAGATDQLIELATLALHSEGFAAGALAALRERHLRVLGELRGGADALAERGEVEAAFAALGELLRGISAVGELTPRTRDAVVSYGERLSPLLVRHALATAGLPAVAADARRVVITDERFTAAQPIAAEVQRAAAAELQPLLAAGSIPVLGGFIGATRRGIGTTLGRGGSDFSAAILGAALGAERIEIWTDVD
ncbi:MAG: lysine-sensitive aspartokinase 3, partial [Terriglobales bacterium]